MKRRTHRLTFALLGLSFCAGLQACSTDPVKLVPIPAPAAVIVKVPTFVALPEDATAACAEPEKGRPILTDVDLYIVAAEWRKAAKCANGRLAAIRSAQP